MGRRIVPTDEEWSSIDRYLQVMEDAKYIPERFAGDKQKQRAVALRAWELGIPLSQALRQFYETEEGLTMNAEMMRSVIAVSGVGLIVPTEMTNERAVVKAIRYVPGQEPQEALFSFSVEDARRAGLGGTAAWQQYPGSLCLARATTMAARAMFADVLCGMSYDPEEVANVRRPAPVAAKAVSAPVAQAPAPEPPKQGAGKPETPKGDGGPVESEAGVEKRAEREEASERKPKDKKQVDAVAPPVALSGETEERQLTESFTTTDVDGKLRTIKTAGVTPEQLRELKRIVSKDPSCLAAGKIFLKKRNLPSTAYLTNDEAVELLAQLKKIHENGLSPRDRVKDYLESLGVADCADAVFRLVEEMHGKVIDDFSYEEVMRLCAEINDLCRDKEAFRLMVSRTAATAGVR